MNYISSFNRVKSIKLFPTKVSKSSFLILYRLWRMTKGLAFRSQMWAAELCSKRDSSELHHGFSLCF